MATMHVDKEPTGEAKLVFNDGQEVLDITDFNSLPSSSDSCKWIVLAPKTTESALDLTKLGVPEIITRNVWLENVNGEIHLWFIPEGEEEDEKTDYHLLYDDEPNNFGKYGVRVYVLSI